MLNFNVMLTGRETNTPRLKGSRLGEIKRNPTVIFDNVGFPSETPVTDYPISVQKETSTGIKPSFFGQELARIQPLDELAISEVEPQQLWSNFYHAVAAVLERKTGQISEVFLNFGSPLGGSVHVCCGSLVVTSKLLPDVETNKFDSVGDLVAEGEFVVGKALDLACSYFDCSLY